jgi:hypothetical protein
MRFEAKFPATRISNGLLVYRANEYSFDVEPRQENFTSVLFNDLNIEVNERGRATSIWGLCPYPTWRAAVIHPPAAEFGDLLFISDRSLVAGVSLRPDKESWPIFFDRDSGWVFLNRGRNPDVAVKLLTGIIAGIDDGGELSGIWLKPDALPPQLCA